MVFWVQISQQARLACLPVFEWILKWVLQLPPTVPPAVIVTGESKLADGLSVRVCGFSIRLC